MENLFDLLQKIKNKGFASITNFAKMDEKNEKFINYEYFTIEKNGFYFYIQNTEYFDYIFWDNWQPFCITAYKKIDYNTKQQVDYPKVFSTYEELKKIVNSSIIDLKNKNCLLKTYKQKIHYELSTYYKTDFGYITLFDYLKKISGYRENEILKKLDKIEMKTNNKNFLILEFYNKNNQSFAINAKNLSRLVIS
jgi:hypothetical protein